MARFASRTAGRLATGVLGGGTTAILDNRDVVLTRWRKSDIDPITPVYHTYGHPVWDASINQWRFFSHNTNNNKVYQQLSPDGRVYANPPTLALDVGTAGSWDDFAVGVPFAWFEAGETRPWRMIYRGYKNGVGSQIGLATSVDGVTWERKDTAGNALSAPIIAFGGLGHWDNDSIDEGGVIKVGSTYYMYYDTMGTPRLVGLATSTDLVTWTKDANNPLFAATAGPDIVGATPDNNQGRFNLDIVRWDTPSGAVRYVLVVSHYTGVHTLPELEVYTCPNPQFYRSDRSFVGTMYRTATTPADTIDGSNVITAGTDTPVIITDDITRNVNSSVLTGHEVRMFIATYSQYTGNNDGYNWSERLYLWDKTLPGKLEADGTLDGCKFVGISQDLPIAAPVIRLAPVGSDANVRGLWLPSVTKTWLDMSGNGLHLANLGQSIDANGGYFNAANSQYCCRKPSLATDPLVTILEADRQSFSVEFTASFASHYAALNRYIYGHTAGAGKIHLACYITGGAVNYTFTVVVTSGASSIVKSATFPVADITLNTPYRFAVCRDYGNGTNGKIYFFKEGTLLNAGGTAFTQAIDDFSASAPPVFLWIANALQGQYWDGYIDQLRVSNTCRHTANYTPAAFAPNYQSSGQIFTGVYDAGAAKRGRLDLQGAVIPANTSITVKARNAANINDQSVVAGDFTLDNPTGQYHQYLITLTTTDSTVTPSITGAVAKA